MAKIRWFQCLGLVVTITLLTTNLSAKSTPYLLTRYIAKEYCSCRFVVKQSAKVCKNENKATNILFRVDEDLINQVITVTNIFTKAHARFLSDNHGCLLVEDKS